MGAGPGAPRLPLVRATATRLQGTPHALRNVMGARVSAAQATALTHHLLGLHPDEVLRQLEQLRSVAALELWDRILALPDLTAVTEAAALLAQPWNALREHVVSALLADERQRALDLAAAGPGPEAGPTSEPGLAAGELDPGVQNLVRDVAQLAAAHLLSAGHPRAPRTSEGVACSVVEVGCPMCGARGRGCSGDAKATSARQSGAGLPFVAIPVTQLRRAQLVFGQTTDLWRGGASVLMAPQRCAGCGHQALALGLTLPAEDYC